MKFGVLQFFAWNDRSVPPRSVYDAAMERIRIMDQTGYDAVWLAEHHFSTYSICPSVHIMGTWVAALTERLRIGTAISLAPFYDPLRLAEEVALLDVISGGRVNWGAGKGFDKTEFGAFGVPFEESYDRLRENVDIVMGAWAEGGLTYSGRFHSYEGVEVLPKPLQVPHPPVWLAASSPESIEGAAKDGFSILMDPHSPHTLLGEKFDSYRSVLETSGHSFEGRDIPMARLMAVADDHDDAISIATKGAGWMLESYVNKDKHAGSRPGRPVFDNRKGESDIERYVKRVTICGTPDEVTDQIHELRETIGLEYLMCAPLSVSTFHTFTEKVLPNFV